MGFSRKSFALWPCQRNCSRQKLVKTAFTCDQQWWSKQLIVKISGNKASISLKRQSFVCKRSFSNKIINNGSCFGTFCDDISQKCSQDWCSLKLTAKVWQNDRLTFCNRYFCKRFTTFKLLLACPFSVFGSLERKPDARKLWKSANFQEASCKRTRYFLNILLDFRFYSLNQRIAICRTLFNDKVPWKCHCIAKVAYQYSQNLEGIWLVSKNKHNFLRN